MRKLLLVLLILIFALGSSVFAQEQGDSLLRGKKIDNIRFDERIGFYEVQSGSEIFYVSKDMKYVFVGVIIDVEKQALLSTPPKELVKEPQKEPQIENAVKIGSGKKTVIEFSDPDCSFCRKAHNFFEEKDVTRYVFFFPLTQIHPDAERKVSHILCSKNKEQAYKDVYGGKYDENLADLKKCDSAVEILKQHKQIASKYGVKVTPFYIINQMPVAGANFSVINELLREEK